MFLGDVVGKVGRRGLKDRLSKLRTEYSVDLVITNGENAAGGLGIDPGTADEIYSAGTDVITTGNHIWQKRTIEPYLEQNKHRIVRPANFPEGAPGVGCLRVQLADGAVLAVMNLQGRVFMNDLLDCPFRKADSLLQEHPADIYFLDFHAEATSEKTALAQYLDSRVQMIVGTHTHVQTADERILPGGTAYITDAGMCGPHDSVIGVTSDSIIERFLSSRPTSFETAKGRTQINGVVFRLDGRAVTSIERISEVW